jgi:hypothetical protein
MAFDNRRTYLCYNNKDLIRDGFIPNFIRKSYRADNSLTNPVTNFNFRRLKNRPKGVTYTIKRLETDSSIIVEVIERKKLLPAEKLMIEIEFSKTMKNAVSHPVSPTSLPMTPVAGLVGNAGLSAIGFGGFSTGFTEMTYHLLESGTKINKRISITQEIIDSGIIQVGGFPLSIFGIVQEHTEVIGVDTDPAIDDIIKDYKTLHPQARFRTKTSSGSLRVEVEAYLGLDFKSNEEFDQFDKLGKFSSGSFQGTGRKRIDGATDSDGLYGGRANAWLRVVENAGDSGFDASESERREVVLFEDQDQLFVKIVDDDRTLKFRGDNKEALGGGVYPFKIRGTTGIDVTDSQIRINTNDLVIGDIIYITYNATVGDRHLRQNVDHKGTIGQGNTVGIIGFQAAVASEQDIFDYKIKSWKVPPLPDGITYPIIDQVTDDYTSDSDYKLTLNEFLNIDAQQREDDLVLTGNEATIIEGWRLSEAILWRRIDDFFAADYRGIIHIRNREFGGIIFPRSSIRDQEWFTEYLESLSFTFPTGPVDLDDPVNEFDEPNLTYLPTDLEKTLESQTNFRDMEGFLFDSSEIVNSLLFDREKLHYYRPFADALKTVSKYIEDEPKTGVGITHLDLLYLLCSSVTTFTETETIDGETITRRTHSYDKFDYTNCESINLKYYDLSYGVFDNTHAQFNKSRNCDEDPPLRSYNYFSTNRDANRDGQGIWYDRGFIENEIAEWRPRGGTINSYWKLETPYFCGDFNNSTRVYIEKMGGNSLDNYSWIYVDTDPFVPNNISADSNHNSSESIVVFSENIMHDGLNYHRISDSVFDKYFPLIKIDKTKNHIRDTYEHTVDGDVVEEAYDHDKNFITGQNRIIGDSPSYSYGIPITEDIFKVCNTLCEPDSAESLTFWFTKDLLNDTWDDGTSFDLDFADDPPRANIPEDWYIKEIEIQFSYNSVPPKSINRYISFYFEDSESSISDLMAVESSPKGNSFVVKFNLRYHFGGPIQFLKTFWKNVNINSVKARFALGGDQSIERAFNLDTYKIASGQSGVTYDPQGRILVFYANESTSNIDIAASYDDGNTWAYDRNIIRLTSSETATMPFAFKDTNNSFVHLFYVLNDKFLMYKKIDTDLIDVSNGIVEPKIPDTYEAGDYDINLDNPEGDYWGDFSYNGVLLRREPSYFVVGSASDDYYIDQIEIIQQINASNALLAGTPNSDKIQTIRFIPASNDSEMRDDFNGSPYAIYISDDGVLRLFFVSNSKLSIKGSYNYITWQYDVFEQSIHKNYMDDELNRGFTEDVSNVQIVRNDYDKSLVSVLYFHNGMLFIRHFYTSFLTPWYDSEGNLHDEYIRSHLEVTDEDPDASPPKKRTVHVPIFLVGVIPEKIRDSIKDDIDTGTVAEDSDLAIYFPYKDPDDHTGLTEQEIRELNKKMVDIFDIGTVVYKDAVTGEGIETDFSIDINTQPYAYTTSKGLIRIFYKDNFGRINGIIIDSLRDPKLEVMNIFNGL